MIKPVEMRTELPMSLSHDVVSTTTKVWETLVASKEGDLTRLKVLAAECPELVYAQYNYTPPIHFAVREGHVAMVEYLLGQGALDPSYITYPFKDSLIIVAEDRDYKEIVKMLRDYLAHPDRCKYKGDNGEIHYDRTTLQVKFQRAVSKEYLNKTEKILKEHPEFALDETYFWGEGIMLFAAKRNNRKLIDLLMQYGAKVPSIIKWAQFYYFERLDAATYLIQKGMNPDTMSWHKVTLLHDMAAKGDLAKAALLINAGADINPVDEEYQSTPLGMAARWGQTEMVELLLKHGADPNLSGASWSTPLSWANKKKHLVIVERLKHSGAV